MVINQGEWDAATQVFYLSGTDDSGHLRLFGVPLETIEDVLGLDGSETPREAVEKHSRGLQTVCSTLAERFPHAPFIMISRDQWPAEPARISHRVS